MKVIKLISILLFCLYANCTANPPGKFVPPEDTYLLILGQDLGAIGGFAYPNNDGYFENIGIVPAGVTTYTSLSGLGGLESLDNWGSGDVCAACIVENPVYDSTILAIGLYLVGQTGQVNSGGLDEYIIRMAQFIKESNRPVFLRIGYEFDGSWNGYDPVAYKNAYRYIVDFLKALSVDNFVSVWQSSGYGTMENLMQWYPGDDYVDWCGYSHFDGNGQGIIDIARLRNKPVLICEATPKGTFLDETDSETIWNSWYKPLFEHIDENSDVIKGLAYINVDWDSQPMWNGNGWGDSRIQINDYVMLKWLEEINKPEWLNKSKELFELIDFEAIPVQVNANESTSEIRVYYSNRQLSISNLPANYNSGYLLRIINVSGRIVRFFRIYESCVLKLSLQQGYYFVSLVSRDIISTKRFIVDSPN